MKKYESPMFFAETYRFSSSIAKCDIDIDTTAPLSIILGQTSMCDGGADGHVYGGQNQKKGSIVENGIAVSPATIFNDGASSACWYDWDGRTNKVAQTGDNFAASFYGNQANEAKHAPGYEGQTFLS